MIDLKAMVKSVAVARSTSAIKSMREPTHLHRSTHHTSRPSRRRARAALVRQCVHGEAARKSSARASRAQHAQHAQRREAVPEHCSGVARAAWAGCTRAWVG